MNLPKLFIAALCFAVSSLVFLLAAPSKRAPATLIVSLPFAALGVSALFASRRAFLHEKSFASRRSERTLASLVPDPRAFVRDAPQLAARFRAWASVRIADELTSPIALEKAATILGDEISLRGDLFLPWVATVGEVHRVRVRGRWSVSRLLSPGEPVVVSGRFPYLRLRPLPEAIELLDVGSALQDE